MDEAQNVRTSATERRILDIGAQFIGISVMAIFAGINWGCQSAHAQRARFSDLYLAPPGTQYVAAQSIITVPGQPTTLPPPVTWQPAFTAGPAVNATATVPFLHPN